MRKKIGGLGIAAVLGLALFTAACSKNQNTAEQASTDTGTAATDTGTAATDTGTAATDTGTAAAAQGTPGDAANGNLAAPVAATSSSAQPASSPPSASSPYTQSASYDYNAESDTGEPPVYAAQAPPPLPEYDQPPCPEQDDIWTPGYWYWSNAGYYWVPGAWVLAPYQRALWTPPYWGFSAGRFLFHHGYWAANIGFYGGINYGYGYTGRGYYGGYWQNNNFYYNRAVTHVNETIIRNVYVHNVTIVNNVRISYNGGKGGLTTRPLPAELAVLHEDRIAAVRAQVQQREQMSKDRAQFFAQNRGRPQVAVAAKPLPVNYHAPAAVVTRVADARALRAPANAPAFRPRPEARPEAHPAPAARSEARPAPAARPEEHPAPAARPEERPAPAARPEAHPAPAARPETHPAPAARPEERPAPANHPAPKAHEAHPAPANHPAEHATHPEQHPNAKESKKTTESKDTEHEH